ncbi:glycosyltransferase family 4 protein [uncultured Chryseobacterium sp.]|uniref:glycosyltransferase family 4 protein n=1 Tax=uncultured Chryseobacterium sp. TaxID=259322 RepID=UPI0025DC8F19|nr:glycosyltransferase family 4 protein [uncultured Chryseobacterium sp.]
MKILLVTQNYPPSRGGMAESCGRIVRNLKRKGCEVHVLHFSNRQKPYVIKTETGGNYSALGIYDTEEYTLNLATLFLEKKKEFLEVDAIVAFGGYLPIMWTPVISQFFGKPLYTCIRGNDFDEGLYSRKRNSLFYALEHSEAILSVCTEKQGKIAKLFPSKKVVYTPNGIDASFWSLNEHEKEKTNQRKKGLTDKKVILIAGQLKFKKGIRHFIESFDQFHCKGDYELWLIGDLPEEVKLFIDNFDLQVKLFPFASKYEMRSFYAMADIVCIPSLYDGMPNVLLEAGASKKLIIASEVGGIPDVIRHGKSGLLYHPLEANALLDVLIHHHHLAEDKKELMKNELYNTVNQKFTEQNEIQNYLNLFL